MAITEFPINTTTFEELEPITDAQSTDSDGVMLYDESVGVMKSMTKAELFKGKVIPIDDITGFLGIDYLQVSDRQQYHLNSFAPGGESGGGSLMWSSTLPKILHDGIRYFSPTVPMPADFDNEQDVQDYKDGVGEEFPADLGVFVLTSFSIQSSEYPSIDGAIVLFDGVSGNRVKNGPLPSEKADIESPAFTGNPTAPTPDAGDDSQSIANTAYVQGEISDRVQSVATIADLRAFGGAEVGQSIYLEEEPYQGFFQSETGTEEDDGRDTIVDADGFRWVRQERTKSHLLADGINSTALPNTLARNVAGINTDRWVFLLGDSHSWGQGAPEWDSFSGMANWSRFSSAPHSNGYMAQLATYLRSKLQFFEATYVTGHPHLVGRIFPADCRSNVDTDIDRTYPVLPELGKVVNLSSELVNITTNTLPEFYNPITRIAADGQYKTLAYREKLSVGLFKNALMELSLESNSEFKQQGKDYFLEVTTSQNYTPGGASWTKSTFGSLNTLVSEWHTVGGQFNLVLNTAAAPSWFAVGETVYIPGFGLALVSSFLSGGVVLRNTNGSELFGAAAPYLYPGARIYPAAYMQKATMRVEMRSPARVSYVCVRHQPNGGVLRLRWNYGVSQGAALRPYLNPNVQFRVRANEWSQEYSDGIPRVQAVTAGHVLSNTSRVTASTLGVDINTAQVGGVNEEVIYRIDWGSRQQGVLYMEGVFSAPGQTVQTRGVVFDNNKIVNISMGANTVGSWIGTQAPTAGQPEDFRDHIEDILEHTPVRPRHVIVQIPFVNEYLKQNPITYFRDSLESLVQKFTDHFETSNNPNADTPPDFLFFTTLRNRDIAFQGAASDPVTYDMYVEEAKNFCETNGYAFVDCEQRLFDMVKKGEVDYPRLFADQNHPSDYANQIIFDELRKVIDVMM